MGEEGKCMEAHLMHTSNAACMGCATSPEMEKTQIKNKAQVDPKDPAWPGVLWDCSQTVLRIQRGACKWMIRNSLQLCSTGSWLSYKVPSCAEILTSVSIHRIAPRSFWICKITNVLADFQDLCVCVCDIYFYILSCSVVWNFCQDISMCQISSQVI